MHVDWAIPCRYVEIAGPTGATIVGAGADVHHLPQIPAVVATLFAVRLSGTPDELSPEIGHPLSCRIFDPDGTLLGEQRGELHGTVDMIIPDYLAQAIIPMNVVMDVQREGSYRVDFQIDDSAAVPVPVHMMLQV